MGKEIKTRQIHKDIKALDKSVTGVERVKRAYVRTKEQAEQTQPQAQEHASPVGYAEDKISRSADAAAHETAHQVRKQGGRAVDALKEKHRVSQEKKAVKSAESAERGAMPGRDTSVSSAGRAEVSHQPEEQMKKLARKRAEKNAVQKNTSAQVRELPKQTIKTIDREEKAIKTAQKAEKTVKSTGKGTIKYASKTVKTSEQASHSLSTRTAVRRRGSWMWTGTRSLTGPKCIPACTAGRASTSMRSIPMATRGLPAG